MKLLEEAKQLALALVMWKKDSAARSETKEELEEIYQKLTQAKKMELIDYITSLRG